MAGLLEKTGKGRFRITERGKEILSTNPTVINMHLLQQFPEYAHARTKGKDAASVDSAVTETKTPQERMASALAELNEALMTDLRTKLATIDPFRFEQVVLQLLQKMGYGDWHEKAAMVTQKGGDESIDGIINEDRLGLDLIYVQAKRWKGNIGRPEIQKFVGALAGKKAAKGVFITTSEFHGNAREYVAGLHEKIVLIDGRRLAELMIEHDIGVTPEQPYVIKKIDSDYFEES